MSESRLSRRVQIKREYHWLEGFNLLVFLMASILYMEIILRVQTESPFVNDGLFYTTLFAGATSLLVYLITSFFKGVGRNVVVGLALGVITVLFMSQYIYYDIFKTFYTVFSATNGGQVVEFMNDILVKIRENILWLLLLLVPLILFSF